MKNPAVLIVVIIVAVVVAAFVGYKALNTGGPTPSAKPSQDVNQKMQQEYGTEGMQRTMGGGPRPAR